MIYRVKRFSQEEENNPQMSSKDLQIEAMKMQRELMRTQRLQQEVRQKERNDQIRQQIQAQKLQQREDESEDRNALKAHAQQADQAQNRPNTGVYKRATTANAPISMK